VLVKLVARELWETVAGREGFALAVHPLSTSLELLRSRHRCGESQPHTEGWVVVQQQQPWSSGPHDTSCLRYQTGFCCAACSSIWLC
jgi:hypothetical protein